jgi:hypothetical protein
MNNKIILVAAAFGMLALAGVGAAIISSYGTMTGAAIVQSAISWDIIETGSDVNSTATNDTHYVLETSYQSDTKWVKVKIENRANGTVSVNVSIVGSTEDIGITVWDADKGSELSNPLQVPSTDMYIWLRHDILATATPGSYIFEVGLLPS